MTNTRQLSKLYIVINFIKNIRTLIPLLVIAYINIDDFEFMKTIWGIAVVIALIAFNFLFSYLPWKKFQYSLEQDRLIIHKGVFKREEKTIYYNRIHSVNVQQPLLLRIFGVASLQIETPGGKPGMAEGELSVLKHGFALELQQQLKQLRSRSIAMASGSPAAQQQTSAEAHEGDAAAIVQEGSSLHSAVELGDQAVLEGSVSPMGSTEDRELLQQEHDTTGYDYEYKLSAGQLLKASLTSLNLNFALIFLLGIYSFADDVLELIFPNLYEKMLEVMSPDFYDSVVGGVTEQFSVMTLFVIVMMTVIVFGFVWLLSIVIYLIKFGDYQIRRSEEQLSVSYGLLEKKSFIFDQNKVQAVIMDENPIRQLLGFAELRVQVITSNAMEQLVIHPFIRKKDIPAMMSQLLPDRQLDLRKQLQAPPNSAYRMYAMPSLIVVLVLIGAAAWLWKWNSLWFLLLIPIVLGWSWLCMRTAGVWLEDGDLILRKRTINRVTYFVRRKHIVTLSMKTSPMQRKRKLRTIRVQVLGSAFAYRVKSIADEHLVPIWQWFSRSGNSKSSNGSDTTA
ncbi:PH domain-containing protein [Paenibacillus septentrionalis]|uniref:PH domain-containing protein n=1 Tax=Paenibacillus septentrionalis TaxID=429342 RepID=A0ABW1V537_9BACL